MTAYAQVDNATCGACVRIPGPGTLAHNSLFALEPGRTWIVRFAGIRVTNSSDPELDAIERGVAFYDHSKTALGAPSDRTLLAPIAPTIAAGRWSDETTLSFGGGANIIAPAGAIYFRPFVKTYGNTPVTDIEVIEAEDITEVLTFGGGGDSTPIGQNSFTLLSGADGVQTGAWVTVSGGRYLGEAAGTFAGTTATFEHLLPDNVTVASYGTLSAPGVTAAFDVGDGTKVRCRTSGGAPLDVFAYLKLVSAFQPSLPAGGTAGQIIIKQSATTNDAIWSDIYPSAMTPAQGDSRYVNLTGDTMTGALKLAAPVAPEDATPKSYVDATITSTLVSGFDYLGEYVDGGVGDGVANDTTVVQAAIDRAAARPAGGTVFLKGLYAVTAVTMKSNVYLQGVAPGAGIKRIADASVSMISFGTGPCANAGLRNCLIDSSTDITDGAGVIAVAINSTAAPNDNLHFEGNRFIGGVTRAYINGSGSVGGRGIFIKGNSFIGRDILTTRPPPNTQLTSGIRFLSPSKLQDIEITGNEFKRIGNFAQLRKGVEVQDDPTWYTNVSFSRNVGTDIMLDPNVSSSQLEMFCATNVTVQGNQIDSGGRHFNATQVRNAVYSGNTSTNAAVYFFEMAKSDGIKITDNTTYNCKTFIHDTTSNSGAEAGNGSTNIQIVNNHIEGGHIGEVGVNDDTPANVIWMKSDNTAGYSDWLIRGNTFKNCIWTGDVPGGTASGTHILIDSNATKRMTVEDNIFVQEDERVGVTCVNASGSDLVIRGNRIIRTANVSANTYDDTSARAFIYLGPGTGGSNILIEDNTIDFRGVETRPGSPVGSIAIGANTGALPLDKVVARRNTIKGPYYRTFFMQYSSVDANATWLEANDETEATANPSGPALRTLHANVRRAYPSTRYNWPGAGMGVVPSVGAREAFLVVTNPPYAIYGDDTGDDAAAIQAILNLGKPTHFIHRHRIGTKLTVAAGQSLTFHGDAGFTLANGTIDGYGVTLNGAGCSIIGGRFDGNRAGQTTATDTGFFGTATNAGNIRFRDCHIHNTISEGITIFGSANLGPGWFTNLRIEDVGTDCLTLRGMNEVFIEDCNLKNWGVRDTQSSAVQIWNNSARLHFVNNKLTNVVGAKFGLESTATPSNTYGSHFTNNQMVGDFCGFSVKGDDIVISGNSWRGTGAQNGHRSALEIFANRVIIENNICNYGTISVAGTIEFARVVGNIVRNSGVSTAAIEVGGGTVGDVFDWCHVSDNIIDMTGATGSARGISFGYYAEFAKMRHGRIENNDIRGPGALGLGIALRGDVGSTDLIVKNNRVTSFSKGIMVENANFSDVVIVDNDCRGNTTAIDAALATGATAQYSAARNRGGLNYPIRYLAPRSVPTVGTATNVTGADSMRCYIDEMDECTLTAVSVRVMTAAVGGHFQIALYRTSLTTRLPTGDPIYTSAALSTDTVGNVSATGLSIPIATGRYCWVTNSDTIGGTAIYQSTMTGASGQARIIGVTGQILSAGFAKSQTYGAWPTLTGVFSTDGLSDVQTSNIPVVMYQVTG